MSKFYGRQPVKHDHRTLRLENYLLAGANELLAAAAPLPAPPPAVNWGQPIDAWRMYGNDVRGCCEVAAAAELERVWSANGGAELAPTDDQVLQEYIGFTGYNPQTGANDNGIATLDLLNKWKNVGLFGGRKIEAFVAINPQNTEALKLGISWFGGVFLGVRIFASDERQFDEGVIWNRALWPGVLEGLHAIPVPTYDEFLLYPVTWGRFQGATRDWVVNRAEEAYAIVSREFINYAHNGQAPNGLNLQQLLADAAALSAA